MTMAVTGAQGRSLISLSVTSPTRLDLSLTQHTVQRGETMLSIAQQLGVPLSELMQANPQVLNPQVLYLDQVVNVPASAMPDQAPAEAWGLGVTQGPINSSATFYTTPSAVPPSAPAPAEEMQTVAPAPAALPLEQPSRAELLGVLNAMGVSGAQAEKLADTLLANPPSDLRQRLATLAEAGISGKTARKLARNPEVFSKLFDQADTLARLRSQGVKLKGALALVNNPEKLARFDLVQERLDLLREKGITGKAARRIAASDSRFARFQEALQQPGRHCIKAGKYRIKFTVNEQGELENLRIKKKRSGLSKIANSIKEGVKSVGRALEKTFVQPVKDFVNSTVGQVFLTVLSYVPIPVVAMAARITMSLNAAYQGIKNGNVLQAVAGVAGAVAGGARALAGGAVSGTAATIASAADKVASVANRVDAAMQAYRQRDWGSLLNLGASAVSQVAQGVGAGAQGVANVANTVRQWSDAVLIGRDALQAARSGDWLTAMNGLASTADRVASYTQSDAVRDVANRLHEASDSVQNLHESVRQGQQLIQGIRDGNVLSAAQGIAQLGDQAAEMTGSGLLGHMANAAGGVAAQAERLGGWAQQGQAVMDALRSGQWQRALDGLDQLGMPLHGVPLVADVQAELRDQLNQAQRWQDQVQHRLAPLQSAIDRAQLSADQAQAGDYRAAQQTARELVAGLQIAGYPTELLDQLLNGTQSVLDTVEQLQGVAEQWEGRLEARGREIAEGLEHRLRDWRVAN